MLHTDFLNQLRSHIRTRLRLHGVETDEVGETVLLRNQFYVGRRFNTEGNTGGWQVLWFAEDNKLEFYNIERELVETSEFVFAPAVQKKAA